MSYKYECDVASKTMVGEQSIDVLLLDVYIYATIWTQAKLSCIMWSNDFGHRSLVEESSNRPTTLLSSWPSPFCSCFTTSTAHIMQGPLIPGSYLSYRMEWWQKYQSINLLFWVVQPRCTKNINTVVYSSISNISSLCLPHVLDNITWTIQYMWTNALDVLVVEVFYYTTIGLNVVWGNTVLLLYLLLGNIVLLFEWAAVGCTAATGNNLYLTLWAAAFHLLYSHVA